MTYIALTTLNFGMTGYQVVCTGSKKDEVRDKAEGILLPSWLTNSDKNEHDSVLSTARTAISNLIVISATNAKRKYGIDLSEPDSYTEYQ